MAYKIRKEWEKAVIQVLRDEDGREKHKQQELERIVEDLFMKLYQKRDIPVEQQREYLKGTNKIRLKEEQKRILNEPITINKIVETLKKQKKGKAAGLDGFRIEYYKTPKGSLLLSFKQVLENIWEEGRIPLSWREATIFLIHKGKYR